jgi:glycine hydroxymethyltransferase
MNVARMTANKNTIPADSASPYYPSGLRLGTPALTTRGMKEGEMRQAARWITEIITYIKSFKLPQDKTKRADFMKEFKLKMGKDRFLTGLGKKVTVLADKFPVPGITD